MKEFKEFNTCWEDAAANSVSGAGVSLPADAAPKKKKKATYDGRTKEGRKFVETMLLKRQANANKKEAQAQKQNLASIQAQAYEAVKAKR